MDERRQEQEGFDLFDVLTHAASAALGFAAGNVVGSRREKRRYERRLKEIENDLVWDTDPSTW